MLPKAVGQNLGKGFLGRGRGQGEVGVGVSWLQTANQEQAF